MSDVFDIDCVRCVRLAQYLEQARADHPDYYLRPVPSFGSSDARLVIVGLAPGFHGANKTGRPFTGDHAGLLLYETLYKFGFSSRPASTNANDGLILERCCIVNAVKCVPPQNKPTGDEIKQCNDYLGAELRWLTERRVILALGRIAHEAVLRCLNLRRRDYQFGHGQEHLLPDGGTLLDSYHCSRYNTQTRRLTTPMFERVFARAREICET